MEKLYKNIIVMKYGVHASEDVESIVVRKMQEVQVAKKMFWGYGGVLCHPLKQVQPFLRENCSKGEKTYLLLSETLSRFDNTPSEAGFYSFNKIEWDSVPKGIKILGSKYAIICKNIIVCDFFIDLANYVIPIGNSKGKILSDYMRGRVDKACGRYVENLNQSKPMKISLYGEIENAVFVK